ncbi:MAG: LPS export ABC transporter periplasmic protein LptC [Treponema sp.]|jgi:LPS export ABC transporter protein LptC|nr:LPS export ABC transporter periplasmic protein LptC [Treponema sp.]
MTPRPLAQAAHPRAPLAILLAALALLAAACSFDYGNNETGESTLPDITMETVEYVRVRGGDPLLRFKAGKAERYEKKQKMELEQCTFEQFGDETEVNASGEAGAASVELDTGNIKMEKGVRIDVKSEDIIIETEELSWKDKERILAGGENAEVVIQRSEGTYFTGRSFSANARERTWTFTGEVEGRYVHLEEGEEKETGEVGARRPISTERPSAETPAAPAAPAGAKPGEAKSGADDELELDPDAGK